MLKKLINQTTVYSWLIFFGGAIFILEVGHIVLGHSQLLITDIGHAGSHLGVALWGWMITRKSFTSDTRKRDLFRLISSVIISVATITGVIISSLAPQGALEHENGWILLAVGLLGILQHVMLHVYHHHDHGHDILCSGLRWHVLADGLKSLMFAGLFFTGIFASGSFYEMIFIGIARITLLIGAISMLVTVIIDIKKKES